jgi:general secretion pathway protein D
LDVKTQQPQVVIVPIKFGDAKAIAQRVQEIFQAGGNKGTGGYHTYKIMTDDRSNAVIVFGPPRTIKDVRALVQQFDIEVDDPSRQSTIHVRLLDYADAKKLAATLSSLATGSSSRTTTNRIVANRPPTMSNRAGGSSSEAPAVADLGDNVKITADESSNSLLITGSRAAYQALNSIIRKLDIRRSQVYVEAEILDINQNGEFNFGTSVFGGYGNKGGEGTKYGVAWEAAGVAPLVVANADANASNPASSSAAAASAFQDKLTIGILSGEEVKIPGLGTFSPAALISLLKSDANSRVLASPHLLTANNEEAEVVVGEKIYFPSAAVNPTTGTVVAKPEAQDVDLTLNIKPSISHSNYVTLKVKLESNSVLSIDGATKLPLIGRRSTTQLLTVKNKQTVVISGLVKSTEQEGFKKIPLLGDIPIIGWLFRNSTVINRQSNLMIFLTPHIVHGAEDLAGIYQDKMTERDMLLDEIYGSGFKDTDFYAKLPTFAAGSYRADAADDEEKERLRQLRRQMQGDDIGSSEGGSSAERVAMPEPEPVTVPLGSTGAGRSDSGGSSGDGGGSDTGGDVGGDAGGDDMGGREPPAEPESEPPPPADE